MMNLTLKSSSAGEYKEKGSRFLSFAYPVAGTEQIEKILSELKTNYHDARHHCYAWRLGIGLETFKVNDDGEPKHSAGDPIFGQIKSYNLTNVLVVVVRYFGGTKLGVGGLVTAYRQATIAALETAEVIEYYETTSFEIDFPYSESVFIESVFKGLTIENLDKEFTDKCLFAGQIRSDEFEQFMKAIVHNHKVKFRKL